MFRFFLCASLILVHVFSQTTEDEFSFSTDSFITDNTTDDHTWQTNTELNTNNETTDVWTETTGDASDVTTEEPWSFNTTGDAPEWTTEEPAQFTTESDVTQEWENSTGEEYWTSTTEQVTEMVSTMTSTMCPPSWTPEMLEEMRREIIDAVLRNISNEINSRLEEIEARLAESNCSKTDLTPAIQLSWQIYENLQIPLTGWLHVFDQPYSHPTRVDDLKQISGICHNEILVGAMYDGVITLAAVGPVSVLTLNTPWNQPKQFGDVYWYSTNGKSFGFAPTSSIRQTSADTQDLDSPQRLSWLLDQNIGGYRAGVTRSLTNDALWHKIVYCN